MWIGLFPELSGLGGIQQVSRHSAAVLMRKARERKLDCQLLGLNDSPGSGSFRVGREEYKFQGFGRNKFRLLLHLLRSLPRLEILYLGHVNLAPLGMLLGLLHPHMQYWVVAHGVEVWQELPLLRRLAMRRARRVLSVSSFTADSAIATQKLNPGRVFLLPLALDPSFLDAEYTGDGLPIPENGRVLLTVGRLLSTEPGKGVDSVIRVLPNVLKFVPDLYYVVIGGGDLLPHLKELAREGPVRDRVLFIGSLELARLKYHYARADVFVMPSRQEGFGLVFLEAMALGKPIVAGKYGGAPEVVEEGVTGFLVDPDDLKGLTDRLVQLLQHETLRHTMGDAGRRRLEQYYTFEAFQNRLSEVLDNAIET